MKTNILTTQILQQKFVNNILFVIEIKALDLKKNNLSSTIKLTLLYRKTELELKRIKF